LKKALCFVLCFLFISLSFSGCGNGSNLGVFVGDSREIIGGNEKLNDQINLKDLSVVVDKDTTKIAFTFIKGSRSAGISEGNLTNVPRYEVHMTDDPKRIAISISGVDFWDYNEQADFSQSPLIYGGFNQKPVGDSPFTVYLQLKSDVEYMVQEIENQLVLTLKSAGSQNAKSNYYVILNAFSEYEDGLVGQDLGFTPSLCDDLASTVIISKPYASKDQADQAKKKADEAISKIAPTKQSYIQQIEGNGLPELDSSADLQQLDKIPILLKDGKEVTLPVAMQNARYLCSAPDGNMLFARTVLPDTSQDVEDVTTEKLWLAETSGKKTQLNIDSFYNVKQASFSSDGRYLAVLDSQFDKSVLYVYDFDTGDLINVGEEGFGNLTSSFTWNKSKDIIYAMTGYMTLQLMQYDLSAKDNKVAAVEEQEGAISDIGLAGGKLYFADSSAGEKGTVYSVDINTAKRTEIGEGISILVSPNQKYAAVLQLQPTDEEAQYVNVVLVNLETGKKSTILRNAVLEDYAFTSKEGKLFLVYDGGDQENFPYVLAEYNPNTNEFKKIANICTSSIESETNSEMLMITDFISEVNNEFQVTYEYQTS